MQWRELDLLNFEVRLQEYISWDNWANTLYKIMCHFISPYCSSLLLASSEYPARVDLDAIRRI
jgi:hypothetical protein